MRTRPSQYVTQSGKRHVFWHVPFLYLRARPAIAGTVLDIHTSRLGSSMNKAIITVVGQDTVGIIARVCTYLSAHQVNVLDISQTIIDGFFNMMMIVDVSLSDFDALSADLSALGGELGLQIRIQRSEIFDAMHRI